MTKNSDFYRCQNKKALRRKSPQGPKKPKRENYSLGAAGCSPAGVSVVVVVVVVVSSFFTSLAASSAALAAETAKRDRIADSKILVFI
jgi:hypothetical protein